MTDKKRKISFSETPRIRSYSTSDPVHIDPNLPQRLADLRLKKLAAAAEPSARRYSEVCRPDFTLLDPHSYAYSQGGSPRLIKNSRNQLSEDTSSQKDLLFRKGKSLEAITVDRYIESIVSKCSNEALASPLDPPPKGSEEYQQVLEEMVKTSIK